ncbi:MAG: beta-glucuronidase, partial [Candidatus Acidiferrales bacterium]
MNHNKFALLIFICLLAAAVPAAAAPAPLIANIPGRKIMSLDGTWRVIVDPFEAGVDMRFWENAKPQNPRDLVEY